MRTERDKRRLSCPLSEFVVKDGYIFSFSWKYNCFFKIDIVSGEIVNRYVVKDYSANAYLLFRLIDAGDSVIAVPYTADCILKWETQSEGFEKVDLPHSFSDKVVLRKFNAVALKEDKLFLFPADADCVCCYDFSMNKIKEVLNIRKCIYENCQVRDPFLFANGSHLINDTIYLGSWEWKTVNIISYDVNKNKVKITPIEGIDRGIRSICGEKNRIFALSGNGKLIMHDAENSKMEVIKLCNEGDEDWWNIISTHVVYYMGFVFAFAERIELSKRVRILDGKIENIFDEHDIWQMKCGNADTELFLGTFDHHQGKIYIYSSQGDIYWYDAVSGKKQGESRIKYDVDELAQWIRENAKSSSYMREDEFLYGLSDLFNILTKPRENLQQSEINLGKAIYLHSI